MDAQRFWHDNSAVQLPHEATVVALFGALKVAAAMLQKGWYVDSVDTTGYENYVELSSSTSKLTRQCSLQTATTPHLPAAAQIVRAIRAKRPHAKIILGGTHATLTVAGYNYEKKHGRVGRAHRAYAQLVELF